MLPAGGPEYNAGYADPNQRVRVDPSLQYQNQNQRQDAQNAQEGFPRQQPEAQLSDQRTAPKQHMQYRQDVPQQMPQQPLPPQRMPTQQQMLPQAAPNPQAPPQQPLSPQQPGPQTDPSTYQKGAQGRAAAPQQQVNPNPPKMPAQRPVQQRPAQRPSGRLSVVSTGLQVKSVSYEGFARAHFELGRATKDQKEKIDKLLRFTPVEIKQPLLRSIGGVQTTGMAITVFAHILAYMEILPGMREKLRHLQQVLSAGIGRPDLRDEIYCQLCKQTNNNPEKEKDDKGWNLLVLCCSSFPPSRELLPSLEVHFQQVGRGAVDGFKGQEQAQRCYDRLQRVAKSGPRYFLPSPDEIEAIWSETRLPMEIFLPDGTDQVLSLHTMSTAEEVATDMANKIGLAEPSYYGIFQCGSDGVEKLCASQGYIIDMQSGWNRVLALQPIRDWRLIVRAKQVFAKKPPVDEVDDANEVSSIPTLVGKEKGRLVFKRKLFLSDPASAGQWAKDRAIAFNYSQAVHEVMTGSYLLTERDALMLGALQLRADLATAERVTPQILEGIDINKYGPKVFVTGSGDEWKAELLKTMTSLPAEPSKTVRMHDYIDFLKSRCPLYQSTWFFVKQNADRTLPAEMFVAINATGVYFAHPKTKDPILHIRFTEICSWGHSSAVASIVTGNVTYNQDHRLITRQGSEIGAAIELFINRMQI